MDVNSLHGKFPAATAYLSQMLLIERDYGEVSNLKLSERLGVSKPAVTQSIKRLGKLDLARQDRYGSIHLTEKGREIGKAVLERHYLIEHVLVDMLDYPWEKSDREAKELQVIISDELKEHLRNKLGNPRTCPHGNPFPDSEEEERLIDAPRLIDALAGERISLIRITEEGEEEEGLLNFCFEHRLKPGTTLFLESREMDGLKVKKDTRQRRGEKPGGRSFRRDSAEPFLIPLSYARHLCYEPSEGSL